MTENWKIHAFSLATTTGLVYIGCAIFDVLFPPYGLLPWLASASPWPLGGSPLAYLTGYLSFTAAGFLWGAIHGIAGKFWSQKFGEKACCS